MSETQPNSEKRSPFQGSTRLYVIIAAALVLVIIVIVVLLVTVGLPALRGDAEPTPVADAPTAAPLPTFTPGPTKSPTDTPPPPPTPTLAAPVMLDTDNPIFAFESAGARPGVDWTGFFGQVLDAQGDPIEGVSVIVWYADEKGIPAGPVVKTDAEGRYEIRLADAPFRGKWSIQVLTDDWQPASKLFTFQTDEDTQAGIQQIQVIWKRVP